MGHDEALTEEQAQELGKLIMMIKAINKSMQDICPGMEIIPFCRWAFGGDKEHLPMPQAWNEKHGDKYKVGDDIMLDEDIPNMVRLYKEDHRYMGTVEDD